MGRAVPLAVLAASLLCCGGCGPSLESCPAPMTVAAWRADPGPGGGVDAAGWAKCADAYGRCAKEASGEDGETLGARAEFCAGMGARADGKHEEAEEHLTQAMAMDPGWAPPCDALGIMALEDGDAATAVGLIEKAVSMDPEWPAAINDLGLALEASGDHEGALARFDAALAIDPLMATAHANRSGVLMTLGRFEEAVASLLVAIDLDPLEPLHYYNLAGAMERLGDWEMAAAAWLKLLDLLPVEMTAAVHLKRGLALEQAGIVDGAEEEYGAAIALAPTSVKACEALAWLLAENGRLDEAWEAFGRLGEIAPGIAAEDVFALGTTLVADGRLGAAARAFGMAVKLRPTWVEAWVNLGAVIARTGALDDAAAVLASGLAAAPDPAIMSNLGSVYLGMQEPARAVEVLEMAAAAAPGVPETRSLLGEALRESGDLEGSLEEHEAAVALDPGSARYEARRGRTLLAMGRTEEWAVSIAKAEVMGPDDPTVLMVKGISLASRKKTAAAAVAALSKALDADPESAEAAAWLAVALSKAKKKDEAKASLMAALVLNPWLAKAGWVADLAGKLGVEAKPPETGE